MKAPDKIYCGNNGHGNLSYSREKVYPSMEEYIRKQTLLKWADEYVLTHRNGTISDQIRSSAIEELIEKLQSL